MFQTLIKKAAAAVALGALLAMAGCSGAEEPVAPAGEVTVSTPPDSPSPTPSASPSDRSDEFDTALKFTKLAHRPDQSELAAAGKLVVPESPAARYLAHQTLQSRADEIAGLDPYTVEPDIKGDRKAGSVKIHYDAVEGESRALTYAWKSFEFEQGKIASWTGASGPVESVLWTRTTSDDSRGRRAVLKSAYLSNAKSMYIVVELSSSKRTSFSDADYAAKDGYRQVLSSQHASDLDAGEKTLAFFVFENSTFGGTLHIPYYDADGTSQGDWELDLPVK